MICKGKVMYDIGKLQQQQQALSARGLAIAAPRECST